MNPSLIRVLALAVVFQSLPAFAENKPLPVSSATPAVAATTTPTPAPLAPLTDEEKKKLSAEFKKALNQQRISMSHQERSSMRELYTAQNQKQKKWREEQKRLRRQFFEQHMSGPERREYVQTYLKKKEEFENSLKSDVVTAKKNWADKQQNLKKSQKEMEDKFNQTISQGQRPTPDLWPSGN